MDLLSAVKRKLSSLAGGVVSSVQSSIPKVGNFLQKYPSPASYVSSIPAVNQNISRLRNIDLPSTAAGGAAKAYLETKNKPFYSPQKLVAQNLPIVGAIKNITSQTPTFFSEQVRRAIPGITGTTLGLLGEMALPGIGGELSAARGLKGLAKSALKTAPIGAAYGVSQAQNVQDIPSAAARGALFAGSLGAGSDILGKSMGVKSIPGLDKIEAKLADSKRFFDEIASRFASGVAGTERQQTIQELIGEAKRHTEVIGKTSKEIESMGRVNPESLLKWLQERSTLFEADRARAKSYGFQTNIVEKTTPPPSTGGEISPLIQEAKKYKSAEELGMNVKDKGHVLDSLSKNKLIDTLKIDSNLLGDKIGLDARDLQKQTTGKLTSDYWLKKIQNGERPPILVGLDNGKLKVIDGNHKATAYVQEGVKDVPVIYTNEAKSQLTDIWNKAQGEIPKGGVGGQIPATPSLPIAPRTAPIEESATLLPFQKDLDRFTALVKQNEKYQTGIPAIGKLKSSQQIASEMGIPHEQLMDQVLGRAGKQVERLPVNPMEALQPKTLPPTKVETIPSAPVVPPPPPVPPTPKATIDNFVTKLKEVFPTLKKTRAEQERLYTLERGKRFGKAQGVQLEGEKGFYAEKGLLKGEMPIADFESLRKNFNQDEIDAVFTYVKNYPYLTYGEKLTTREALVKLFGAEGTKVPTEGELKLLSEVFGKDFTDTILSNRPFLQKLSEGIGQVLSLPRALMAGGLDMSFGLRQGVFGAFKYPKQWASSFKDQFKWFFNEKALEKTQQMIRSDPDYLLARKAKLAFTDLLSKREEQFISNLAERIPVAGTLVRASSRAYTGFANKFRFDIFKSLVNVAKKTGDIERPGYIESLAKHINTLTGRGSLGDAERAASTMATALFSPRLLVSRIQLINPVYYARLDPAVRKEAVKGLFAYVTGMTTLLGLIKASGIEVGTDTNSSDFGKMKVGNTRIDMMGGFQQQLVLLSRMISGKMTSSTTGAEMVLGDPEKYKPTTRFDIAMRFFESKEAPVVSFLTSLLKGKDFAGQPIDIKKELVNRVTPMFIQNMIELYKGGDLEIWPVAAPAAFFGAGVQTYGGTPKDFENTMKVQYDKGEPITPKVLENVPVKVKADLLYSQLKKAVADQDKTILERIKKSGLYTPEVKAQAAKYAKLEKLGIMKADRDLLQFEGAARAGEALKRIQTLSPKNQAKHLKLLIDAKIITPDVLAEMKKLYKK